MQNRLTDLIDSATNIVSSTLIPLAFALCLLYFFWGMVKYIRSGAGGEKAAIEGRRIMIWGVVGLFVATSIWGIVTFIRSELGIRNIQNVNRPLIEGGSSRIVPGTEVLIP